MASTSLVFGEQENLKIKHGDHFDGHTFTITDSNGDAYTFPDGVDEIDMKFYTHRGGSQVGATLAISTGELSRASEVITWSTTFATWDTGTVTTPGATYYYELTLTTTTGSKHLTIAYGYSELV